MNLDLLTVRWECRPLHHYVTEKTIAEVSRFEKGVCLHSDSRPVGFCSLCSLVAAAPASLEALLLWRLWLLRGGLVGSAFGGGRGGVGILVGAGGGGVGIGGTGEGAGRGSVLVVCFCKTKACCQTVSMTTRHW